MSNVNEKTLELNITHEILSIVHRFDRHAFAFGTTLRQEQQFGYDSRVLSSLPSTWRSAVFQYKRAYEVWQDSQGNPTYWFEINNNTHNDQHQMLHHFSGGQHNIAFYIFPAFLQLNELRQHATYLLSRTYLADVTDIPPALVGNVPHDIEVFPHLLTARIHSEGISVKLCSFESLIPRLQGREIGLPIESLLANAREKPRTKIETTRARVHFMVFLGE